MRVCCVSSAMLGIYDADDDADAAAAADDDDHHHHHLRTICFLAMITVKLSVFVFLKELLCAPAHH